MDGFWEVLGGQLGGENRLLRVFFDVFFEVDVGIDFCAIWAPTCSHLGAQVGARRRRTTLSVSCPCLVFVGIFRKILSGVCLLSRFCLDFLSGVGLSGFYLSRFCPLSGFCPDFKEKSCLVSVCPDFFYLDSVRCRDFVRIFRK